MKRSCAQVPEMEARCQALKAGSITVAIDGTKVLAHAGKHSAVSYYCVTFADVDFRAKL